MDSSCESTTLIFRGILNFSGIVCEGFYFFFSPLSVSQLPSGVANCKVVGCASGVGLLPAALGPNFLDKGVGTGPVTTQIGPAYAQTKPGLPGTYLR